MKTILIIGIVICVLVLIGVLILSIKKKSINLPEIIVSVTATILSILLAVTFNGRTKETDEKASNTLTNGSKILNTDSYISSEPTENNTESIVESSIKQNNRSSIESANDLNDDTSKFQVTTSTNETSIIEAKAPETKTTLEPEPVSIKTLILKSSSENYNISQTEYDPRGKMYTNVIRLSSSATNGIVFKGKLELYIERKYSTFSCSFVPESNYSTNSGAGAYIEIYKDDVLAYTSNLITYKTTSIDVNLDIQNVEYLKVKIINVNKNHPYMANADTLLCNAYVTE